MERMQEEIKEELSLLRQLVNENARVGNLVLSVIGILLALAGVASLIYSIMADKKITQIHAHTSTLVSR